MEIKPVKLPNELKLTKIPVLEILQSSILWEHWLNVNYINWKAVRIKRKRRQINENIYHVTRTYVTLYWYTSCTDKLKELFCMVLYDYSLLYHSRSKDIGSISYLFTAKNATLIARNPSNKDECLLMFEQKESLRIILRIPTLQRCTRGAVEGVSCQIFMLLNGSNTNLSNAKHSIFNHLIVLKIVTFTAPHGYDFAAASWLWRMLPLSSTFQEWKVLVMTS